MKNTLKDMGIKNQEHLKNKQEAQTDPNKQINETARLTELRTRNMTRQTDIQEHSGSTTQRLSMGLHSPAVIWGYCAVYYGYCLYLIGKKLVQTITWWRTHAECLTRRDPPKRESGQTAGGQQGGRDLSRTKVQREKAGLVNGEETKITSP